MKYIFNNIKILNLLLMFKLFKHRVPLFVGFSLTNKCNLSCKYCKTSLLKTTELDTNHIIKIINQLGKLGCQKIWLTGGEPLLRNDLSDILKTCRKNKIYSIIATNGWLIKEQIETIKYADEIVISLDGPKKIHDYLRGPGSFDRIQTSLNILKSLNKKYSLTCVLNKYNKNCLPFFNNYSLKHKTKINIQLLSNIPILNNKNLIKRYLINKITQKQFIDQYKKYYKKNSLINFKTEKINIINDSKNCPAGNIYFRITTDGKLLGCWRQNNYKNLQDLQNIEIKEAIGKLEKPSCSGCNKYNAKMAISIAKKIKFY